MLSFMRFAIFGDIHANLEALEAVIADALQRNCNRFVCLGDVVGYNADPKACLDRVRELGCPVVKGNHDEYASTNFPLDAFNPLAEKAIVWTREQLQEKDKDWLRNLPLVCAVETFTIVHATLADPGEWGYVLNQLDALASFSNQKTTVCFFGHTHAPRLFVREGSVIGLPFESVLCEQGKKYFINVGSVGQPRDGDWRAAYAVFDFKEQIASLHRVEYEVQKTKRKIVQAGLPAKLAERLELGK
jgi:predicted phosphodiesterase